MCKGTRLQSITTYNADVMCKDGSIKSFESFTSLHAFFAYGFRCSHLCIIPSKTDIFIDLASTLCIRTVNAVQQRRNIYKNH